MLFSAYPKVTQGWSRTIPVPSIMNTSSLDPASAESLLAFWRDAGVDACYGDAPVDHTHVAPPPAVKAVQRATASVVTPLAGVKTVKQE